MPMPAPGQAIPVQVNSPLPRSPEKKVTSEGSDVKKNPEPSASATSDLPPGWGADPPAPGPVTSPRKEDEEGTS